MPTKNAKKLFEEEELLSKVTATPTPNITPTPEADKKAIEARRDKTNAPVNTNTPIFTSGKTGQPSGFVKDGQTFFGSEEDIRGAVEREQAKNQAIVGATPISQLPTPSDIALAEQVGTIDEQRVAQATTSDLDFKQALQVGLTAGGKAAAGGAAAGLLTGGTLSVPLAAAGGIGFFIGGVISDLKSQSSDNFTIKTNDLKKRDKNLRALITDTNKNPSNAAENYQLFREQLTRIEVDYQELHLESQRDLNKFLGKDGNVELAKYQTFYEVGGARDFYKREMQIAILNPDPSKSLITLSDVSEEND